MDSLQEKKERGREMALKHMKSYSAPLIKKEMQIMMTMKFIFHLSDCNIKEFDNTEKWLSANGYNFCR